MHACSNGAYIIFLQQIADNLVALYIKVVYPTKSNQFYVYKIQVHKISFALQKEENNEMMSLIVCSCTL